MGEPVMIDHMARELIRLTGQEPETEIEIRYVGLRAGEKLYEELISVGEGIIDTQHEKVMVLRGENNHSCTLLNEQLQRLAESADRLDSRGIKEVLHAIVPEYQPDFSVT